MVTHIVRHCRVVGPYVGPSAIVFLNRVIRGFLISGRRKSGIHEGAMGRVFLWPRVTGNEERGKIYIM